MLLRSWSTIARLIFLVSKFAAIGSTRNWTTGATKEITKIVLFRNICLNSFLNKTVSVLILFVVLIQASLILNFFILIPNNTVVIRASISVSFHTDENPAPFI